MQKDEPSYIQSGLDQNLQELTLKCKDTKYPRLIAIIAGKTECANGGTYRGCYRRNSLWFDALACHLMEEIRIWLLLLFF